MSNSIEHTDAVKVAARFLERRGYKVLETGWSCGEGGADIVAMDNGELVLALVRAKELDDPYEGISAAERRRLEAGGLAWARDRSVEGRMRIDVVHVTYASADRAFIKHVHNAEDDPFATFVDDIAQGDAEVRAKLAGLGRGAAQDYVRALIAADITSPRWRGPSQGGSASRPSAA